MIPLSTVLRALHAGGSQGGPYRDTDPLPYLTEGLAGGVGDPRIDGHADRTVRRRGLMAELDELCFWHLLITEIDDAGVRAATMARRELHLRLQNAQILDDVAYAKAINQ